MICCIKVTFFDNIFSTGWSQDGTPTTKTFDHVPSEIGAEEAEEVGVEHLLRDIKDTTVGSLSQRVTNQLMGLKGLHAQLSEIHTYLEQVASGRTNFHLKILQSNTV